MNNSHNFVSTLLALAVAAPALASAQSLEQAAGLEGWQQPVQAAPGAMPAAAIPAPTVPHRLGTLETLKPGARKPQAKTPAAYAPIDPRHDAADAPEIELFAGESRVFPTPGVARIAVGNGQVITANALDDREIIIFGNAPGTSSLFVWHEDGRYQRLRVNVSPGETSRVAREVAAFLQRIPKARASVVGDKVIVEGDDLSDEDREKVAELAKRYPQIVNFTSPVGWEQTVLMDVKVVEFPKAALRELGLKWIPTGGGAIGGIWYPGGRGDVGGRTINIISPQSGPSPLVSQNPSDRVTLPSQLTILSAINMGLNAQLNVLEQNGTASILAEPQLSTRSGYKASFLAGGELPYSVSSINGVTIVFKPYGIKLEVEPKVGRNGVIRAIIDAEVSALDPSVTTAGGPALLSRKTKTEFNVRTGETIVLSGLLQRDNTNSVDKVPFLGDIPVLGALFRSKRFQNKETELVVFVTPNVVDSRSPGLVDRVQRATQRLSDRMDVSPFLSDPLQPATDAGKVFQPLPPEQIPAPKVEQRIEPLPMPAAGN